jgi:hypothetical protein
MVSGGLGLAGLGLAAGTAHADHVCTVNGVCNRQWCPGQPLPRSNKTAQPYLASEIHWDWSVCHWVFNDNTGQYAGASVEVAPGLYEGDPVLGDPCFGAPFCLPGL